MKREKENKQPIDRGAMTVPKNLRKKPTKKNPKISEAQVGTGPRQKATP